MSVGDVSVGEEKVTPMAVRCQQIFFGRKTLPTSGHGWWEGGVRVTEFFEFITKYDEEKYDAIFS